MLRSQIGVCTWSLRPGHPRQLVERLRLTGLDAVQLALSPVVRESVVWGKVIDELRAEGFRILSGMMAMKGEDYSTLESIARTGGVRPDETWLDTLAHAEAVADLASAEDIGLVTFHAGFLPEDSKDPERTKLLDRLRQVAGIFAQRRIQIAFETGQESALTLLGALVHLACPNVGVNFDPANMILYRKGYPVDALRMLSPFVRQVHIKDAIRSKVHGEWGTEVPVGQGMVDWGEFFDATNHLNPPVNFIIEREAGNDRTQDIIAASERISDHLARSSSRSR